MSHSPSSRLPGSMKVGLGLVIVAFGIGGWVRWTWPSLTTSPRQDFAVAQPTQPQPFPTQPDPIDPQDPTQRPNPPQPPNRADDPLGPMPIEDMQAELRALREQVVQLLDRIQALEAELEQQAPSPNPTLDASTAAQITSTPTPADPAQPSPSVLPTLDPPNPTSIPTAEPTPESTSPPLHVGTQTISLPGDVLFDFDKATIRPEAATLLQRVADSLREMSSARILVAGHTDNIGDESYNLGLSLDRANAVMDYLTDQLPDDKPFSWSATGYGSSQPIADNSTSEGRQRNRRVDVIIAP